MSMQALLWPVVAAHSNLLVHRHWHWQSALQIQGHMYLLGVRVQHVSRIQECRVDSQHAEQHSTSCCPERSTKDNEKALQAVVLVVFLDFENVIHVCGLECLF